MIRQRGILTLGLLALLAVAGLGAWRLVDPPLSPPATADMRGLMRWLLRDLAAEPPEIQQALVDRLQIELLTESVAELPWGDAARYLSSTQLKRLANNAELLKKIWFHTRVGEYANCPQAERAAFLDRQMAVLFRWLEIDAQIFSTSREEGLVQSPLTVGEFFNEIDRWMAESQGLEHEQMVGGVRDAVAHWLATRSLVAQPPETVRELALHIAKNLKSGPPSGGFGLVFTSAELKQLEQNGHLLMEAWFREQARLFAALSPGERGPFVEGRVAEMQGAQVLELLQGQSPGDAKPSAWGAAHSGLTFLALANSWIERAGSDEKKPLAEFLAAFQARYFAEQMRTLFPLPRMR